MVERLEKVARRALAESFHRRTCSRIGQSSTKYDKIYDLQGIFILDLRS